MSTGITRRELLFGTAAMVAGSRLLRAQAIGVAQRPTFSTDVELVSVNVVVRDKKGALVRDLTQEEFSLTEDGRSQIISLFSREGDAALTLGLLVDTTPSESNMLGELRRASLAFLQRMLRPGKDTAFLMQYYSRPELLQGPTSSREALEAALEQLGVRESGWGSGGGYSAVLASAIQQACREVLAAQQGRKALLILGDGDHLGAQADDAIAAAERTDTQIFAIRIYDKSFGANRGPGGGPGGGGPGGGGPGGGMGPGGGGIKLGPIQIGLPGGGGMRGGGGMGGPGGGPGGGMGRGGENGEKNLKRLSKETGGGYFEVGKKQTLDRIYATIEEELRSQYSLGYAPDAKALPGYRFIKVNVKRKGLRVRSREGYYSRAR
jgi:hypothetical protein